MRKKELHVSAGTAEINDKSVHFDEQTVPQPTEPGHYGVYATTTGKIVIIKIADLTIPAPAAKDRSQAIAEFIGVAIGILAVIGIVAVGVTFLIRWLLSL